MRRMTEPKDFIIHSTELNAISQLRHLGFDVVIMNFPVIGDKENPILEGRETVHDGNNNIINKKGRDGGTDYIQRNAMLMVRLIQEVNHLLLGSGSTEKLCVLGPSMGGQITKYALAYMEKQEALGVPNMDHNTRVWCSFDSPHLGAYVPLGVQVTTVALGKHADQSDARIKYNNNLGCPAARQQLITQTELKFSLPIYQTNLFPVRQTYLSDVANNGLAFYQGREGFGYPLKLKKIAYSNTSDQGTKNGLAGSTIIRLKANFLAKKVFNLFENSMGNTNDQTRIMYLEIGIPQSGFHLMEIPKWTTNDDFRGSLDIIPGSWLRSNGDTKEELAEKLDKKWGVVIKENFGYDYHTFMPAISTLGFIDEQVDWSQRLNDRDLVCNREIVFDSYFVDGENKKHITITQAAYNWLEYQFLHGDVGCDPICGTYTLSGDQNICDGNTSTVHKYTLTGNIPTGQSLAWEVTGDLITDNPSGNTVGIKITASTGSGVVKGILTNDCGDKIERSYNVQIGTPDISLTADFDELSCLFEVTINSVPAGKTPLSYEWSNNGTSYTNGDKTKTFFMPAHYTSKQVYARANWGCGYTYHDISLTFPEVTDCDDNWPAPVTIHKESNTKEDIMLTPNPTKHGWKLSIPERVSDNYEITLTDANNKLIRTYKSISTQNELIIEGESLKPGMYFLKIISKTNQFSLRAIKI